MWKSLTVIWKWMRVIIIVLQYGWNIFRQLFIDRSINPGWIIIANRQESIHQKRIMKIRAIIGDLRRGNGDRVGTRIRDAGVILRAPSTGVRFPRAIVRYRLPMSVVFSRLRSAEFPPWTGALFSVHCSSYRTLNVALNICSWISFPCPPYLLSLSFSLPFPLFSDEDRFKLFALYGSSRWY